LSRARVGHAGQGRLRVLFAGDAQARGVADGYRLNDGADVRELQAHRCIAHHRVFDLGEPIVALTVDVDALPVAGDRARRAAVHVAARVGGVVAQRGEGDRLALFSHHAQGAIHVDAGILGEAHDQGGTDLENPFATDGQVAGQDAHHITVGGLPAPGFAALQGPAPDFQAGAFVDLGKDVAGDLGARTGVGADGVPGAVLDAVAADFRRGVFDVDRAAVVFACIADQCAVQDGAAAAAPQQDAVPVTGFRDRRSSVGVAGHLVVFDRREGDAAALLNLGRAPAIARCHQGAFDLQAGVRRELHDHIGFDSHARGLADTHVAGHYIDDGGVLPGDVFPDLAAAHLDALGGCVGELDLARDYRRGAGRHAEREPLAVGDGQLAQVRRCLAQVHCAVIVAPRVADLHVAQHRVVVALIEETDADPVARLWAARALPLRVILV